MTGAQVDVPTRSHPVETNGGAPDPRGRRPRIRWLVRGGLVIAIAATVAGTWLLLRGGTGGASESAPDAQTALDEVTRRDLVVTETVDGTLEYAGSRAVIHLQAGTSAAASGSSGQVSSRASGLAAKAQIVTWLPEEGATAELGEVLYRVNGKATYLLVGEVPVWRALSIGLKGDDVLQLETSLVAMGYGEKEKIAVDRHFGAATKAAVKRWQKDGSAEQTGRLKLGTVVFLPGARRVGTLETEIGAQVSAGMVMMNTTSNRQVVTVALDTTDQDLVAVGDEVTVELPGGDEVPGTVAHIGRVAESAASETGQEQNTSDDATVGVTIELDGTFGVDFDRAPVDIEIATEAREDVLTVPVTALVALAGGGYAVEIVDATGTHLVAVEPGLYADGFVEVTGEGLEEGAQVVVPA